MVQRRQQKHEMSSYAAPTAHLQVVRSLKRLEGESFGNGAVVEVRDLDYNLLSWEDQIKNDLETDVMVRDRPSSGCSCFLGVYGLC